MEKKFPNPLLLCHPLYTALPCLFKFFPLKLFSSKNIILKCRACKYISCPGCSVVYIQENISPYGSTMCEELLPKAFYYGWLKQEETLHKDLYGILESICCRCFRKQQERYMVLQTAKASYPGIRSNCKPWSEAWYWIPAQNSRSDSDCVLG